MKQASPSFSFSRRHLLLLGLLVIGLYVLLPQIGNFHASWHLLQHPKPLWLAAAIGLTALTYLAAATTYYFLAFKPLPYRQLVLVQLAVMFINRLLPGGIGALSANFAYLRRQQHGAAQATTMVATNNLFGFVGNGLLVVLALLWPGSAARKLQLGQAHDGHVLVVAGVIVAAIAVALLLNRRRLVAFVTSVSHQALSYRHRPGHLLAALSSSMVLTLCNVFCLYCCALAVGLHLPAAPALLILSFGVGAGIATPTPGGLGGFEAGLVGGMVAYHVGGATALAVALLYRLVSYWLALLAGAVAFTIAQRQRLFL